MKPWILAVVIVIAACGSSKSSEPAPKPAPTPAPTPPTPTPVSPAPTPKPTPTPAAGGLPAFADLSSIELHQQQGGPSVMHCNGTVYELAVDLAKNTWTSGLCMDDKLTAKHGAVTAAQHDAIAAAYGKLAIRTAETCGNDGGTLTLTAHETDGTTATYVDENWGCRKPPPVIADGLKDLANALGPIALYGP